MIEEIWKDIKEYEGLYQISSLGRVKSLNHYGHKGRIGYLTIFYYKKHEYAYVELKVNKKAVKKKIHRLLGEHFLPNPENKPQINHIDGDKRNFSLKNLEWATSKENMNHADKTKLRDISGTKNKQSKLKENQVIFIRDMHREYKKLKTAGINNGFDCKRLARMFNVSFAVICGISSGRMWKSI